MKKIRIGIITAIIAIAMGCGKDGGDQPDTSKYTIYTAGIYDDYRWIGCFWKNGIREDFNPGGNGMSVVVTGLSVSNGIIYVSGYYHTDQIWYNTPCYWKNGVKTDLPDDTDLPPGSLERAAYAKGIYAVGNDVYTVGRYNVADEFPYPGRVQPCYWKNTTRFDITDYPDRFAEATCIFVSGNDIYFGGNYAVPGTSPSKYQACYWKNGVKTDLPGDNSYVKDIFVENGKVYAVGYCAREHIQDPCYWADGQKLDLSFGDAISCSSNAIFVDNGAIYIAGGLSFDGYSYACYWKDGKQTKLTKNACSYSIFVKDGIVFSSGCCDAKSGKCDWTGGIGTVPCYWINTKCTELSVEVPNLCDTYNNNAIGIFVE